MAEATLFVSGGAAERSPAYLHLDKFELERHKVAVVPCKTGATRTLVGCGHAWLDQKILIVDPESCAACPPGRIGEIWVSGSSVASGYWNRPEETDRAFRAYLAHGGEGPFLRTGDLGFIQDGELFITGRLKDLIIIHGRNHAPEDIELSVSQVHASLRLGVGAAFSIDVNAEEKLVIVQGVEREYLRALDANSLIADIREAILVEHGITPYAVVLAKTNSVPKTSSGKVQRRECRQRFLNGELEVLALGERPWLRQARESAIPERTAE
jgi:acyl-CoA synthetase (AMP-forming)/AMP-acid ligase II